MGSTDQKSGSTTPSTAAPLDSDVLLRNVRRAVAEFGGLLGPETFEPRTKVLGADDTALGTAELLCLALRDLEVAENLGSYSHQHRREAARRVIRRRQRGIDTACDRWAGLTIQFFGEPITVTADPRGLVFLDSRKAPELQWVITRAGEPKKRQPDDLAMILDAMCDRLVREGHLAADDLPMPSAMAAEMVGDVREHPFPYRETSEELLDAQFDLTVAMGG